MKNSWLTKKLGEVTDIYSGGTPLRSNPSYWAKEVPWLTMEDVNGNFNVTGTVQYISNEGLQNSNAQLVPVGSVNLSCTASVGNVTISRIPLATNQQFNSLHPKQNSGLSPEFLAYRLIFDRIKIQALGGSTTFQFISKGTISNFEIPIPESKIQQKIVERLDAIRKVQELCDTQIQKTEELFITSLQIAFNKDVSSWIKKRFDEVCVLQRGFDLPKRLRKSGAFPLASSNGITDYINVWKIKAPGVVTGRSGTIGSVHYVDKDFWPLNTTLFIKDFCRNDPRFVYYFLQKFDLLKYSSGTGVPTLNRNIVHKIIVSIPPKIYDQKRIVEKLDAIQNYKKLLLKQKELLRELFESVLYKSMKGEMD